MSIGFVVLLLSGIAAGFTGGHGGRWWIWLGHRLRGDRAGDGAETVLGDPLRHLIGMGRRALDKGLRQSAERLDHHVENEGNDDDQVEREEDVTASIGDSGCELG